jgi:hypothetical protein
MNGGKAEKELFSVWTHEKKRDKSVSSVTIVLGLHRERARLGLALVAILVRYGLVDHYRRTLTLRKCSLNAEETKEYNTSTWVPAQMSGLAWMTLESQSTGESAEKIFISGDVLLTLF